MKRLELADASVPLPQPDGSVDVRRKFDHWLGITPSFNVLWEF